MKIRKILIAVSEIAVALLFVVLSVYAITHSDDTVYRSTKATIVRIEEEYDTLNEQYEHKVYVDYELDGVKWENIEYGAYDSSMKVGDTVKVIYDMKDPTSIQAEGSVNVPYIVGGVGLAFLAFGVFMLVKAIREE